MDSINSLREKLDKALHEKDSKVAEFFGMLETKSGVDRTRIALGLCLFIALYLAIGYGKDFVCNFIGFVYPAYTSVKAIESPEKDDDTKWLTYWVVYAVFVVVESFTDIFLSWIPLYFLCKCIFLIYCMNPTSANGSLLIYNRFIRPFILRHESVIDTGIDYAKGVGKQVLTGAEQAAGKVVSNAAFGGLYNKDD